MKATFNTEAGILKQIVTDPMCVMFTGITTLGAVAASGPLGLIMVPLMVGGIYVKTLQNRLV